jgi:hypothetical protein
LGETRALKRNSPKKKLMVGNFFVVAEGKKNRRNFENKEKPKKKGKWGFEVVKYLVRGRGGFI